MTMGTTITMQIDANIRAFPLNPAVRRISEKAGLGLKVSAHSTPSSARHSLAYESRSHESGDSMASFLRLRSGI